ncbi:MAG: WG repeat-containing protein [Bacteroidota bacterium]
MINYKEIKLSEDRSYFSLGDHQPLWNKMFVEAGKFHSPGLAPVKDDSGAYHIDTNGQPIYSVRYTRVFGYYGGIAGVQQGDQWFHILPDGSPLYKGNYRWVGNFQQNRCAVQDAEGYFLYIKEKEGIPLTQERYKYAGDFRESAAAVQLLNGRFTHIHHKGASLHGQEFLDLGVYHKGYAVAKDGTGWFHIDREGQAIYSHQFAQLEPFYNGWALAIDLKGKRLRVNEEGEIIML